MGWRRVVGSLRNLDQVPDLNEKANLTQESQVPELKELNLVEDMRQLQNAGGYQNDNHIKVLSNMMEEETHVVDSMSDHEGYARYCLKL